MNAIQTEQDSAESSVLSGTDRRGFLTKAGLASVGIAGASLFAGASSAQASGIGDADILNFALNLEYLEGEFYSFAVHGHGLAEKLTTGKGTRGPVVGGHAVPFKTRAIRAYAREIAGDEVSHVRFLRGALGSAAVARPKIDIRASFTAAARAAGLVGPRETFNVYANENNFLLGAFIFEDVGVTAYKGAAALIANKTYLEAAAGILSVEAYHAGIIRTSLYRKGLEAATVAISAARDSLDGRTDLDQGIKLRGRANLVPTDKNGLTYSRSAAQVLNIAYLNPRKVSKGGFFPHGVNGSIRTSGGS